MRKFIIPFQLIALTFTTLLDQSMASPLPTDVPALGASYQVIHSFSGTDGAGPNWIIQGSDGSFFGTTASGGPPVNGLPDGAGTVFKIDPTGLFTTIHGFDATDGYLPDGLVQAPDGQFYGVTAAGGQPSGGGAGTVFQMDAAGNLATLYAFVGGFVCCDGATPNGPPVLGADGKLYGVTSAGGAFRDIDHQGGFGAFYSYDLVSGTLTILHSFNLADGNGIFPNGPLAQGSDGFFYGTTQEGGGGVFRVDAAGNLTLLHGITDSAEPLAGLIQGSDGAFYGTTDGPPGTVFRIDVAGNYSVVNQFDGPGGFGLNQRLLQANDGFFYGTAPQGGLLDFQAGDLFRLSAASELRVLHSFTQTDTTAGIIPSSPLMQAGDGSLYGATAIGGSGGRGTLFRFDLSVEPTVASVSLTPGQVPPGGKSTGVVMLSAPAPAGGTVVSLAVTSFNVTVPSTVIVKAGAKTAKFSVQVLGSATPGDVRAYASVAGEGPSAILTITDNTSVTLSSFSISPTSVKGGQSATGTVTLSAPAPSGGAVVTLTHTTKVVTSPPTVTVAAGETSASFTITTKHVRRTTVASFSASYNSASLTANLTVTP